MSTTIRKTATAVLALAAIALGGAAIAGAAQKATPSSTPQGRPQREALSTADAAKVKAAALAKVPGATVLRTEPGGPNGSAYHAHIRTSAGKLEVVLVDKDFKATAVQADDGPRGGGPNGGRGGHSPETPLTGDTKSKVEAAVLAKYAGATIVRTETNTDGSAPYESHITTKDGKQLEVHVSKAFAVVDAQEGPGHP
jgi:uncharacterized membrane protein YkoI